VKGEVTLVPGEMEGRYALVCRMSFGWRVRKSEVMLVMLIFVRKWNDCRQRRL
jgi:hypothetical protein